MGCDIHAAMEYKNGDGKWHCLRIPKPNPHTQIQWQASYMDCAKGFWVKTMPYALNLGKKYGIDNVRIVMDFDS